MVHIKLLIEVIVMDCWFQSQ